MVKCRSSNFNRMKEVKRWRQYIWTSHWGRLKRWRVPCSTSFAGRYRLEKRIQIRGLGLGISTRIRREKKGGKRIGREVRVDRRRRERGQLRLQRRGIERMRGKGKSRRRVRDSNIILDQSQIQVIKSMIIWKDLQTMDLIRGKKWNKKLRMKKSLLWCRNLKETLE